MEIFIRLSGLLAMFSAWVFVVAPAIRYGIDGKRQTISSLTRNVKVRIIVSFGLIIGTIFQIIFLVYLHTRFPQGLSYIGSMIYLSAQVATIMVVLFPEYKHFKIHNFFVKYYFVFFPISLVIITGIFPSKNSCLFILNCLVTLSYFLGTWWSFSKFGASARVEQQAFLILSLWIVFLTIV